MTEKARNLTTAALLSILCFGVGLTIVGPLLSVIANEYDFPIRYSGVIFSSNFFGFILFNITFALYLTHIDLRKILVIILFAYSLCLAAFTQANSFPAVLVLMFLIGGLGGLIESTSSVLIVKLNRGREGYYLNLSQVFFGIGAIIGPLGSGYMEQAAIVWQNMFVLVAVLSAISGAIFLFFRMEVKGSEEKLKYKDFMVLTGNKKLLILMVCMMLYTGAEIGMWGWISTLLKNSYAALPMEAGFAVALFWVFMTVGRYITAKLTNSITLKRIILILSIGATASTLVLAIWNSERLLWIMIPFIGLFLSGIWPTIVALSGDITGKHSGPAAYMVIASGALGGMVFPYIIGFFGQGSSVMISLGIIALMSAAIFGLIKVYV
ncbi:MAG TPA: MFS transporter [Anaerovoracaceae bacterium]|nr:MFS transporter [Anaerovoracaceae bacterium]